MSRPSSGALAGTLTLIRHIVRRDRFRLIIWVAVAVGVVLAVAVAWVTVRVAAAPLVLRRTTAEAEHVEGDDVVVDVEVEAPGRTALASATLVEWIVKLGERRTRLRWRRCRLRGGICRRSCGGGPAWLLFQDGQRDRFRRNGRVLPAAWLG